MKKILILFAHPRLEKSRSNTELLKQIPLQENITFHDLYETYPDFNIDIEREKALLVSHEIIIWQHPFYWYSCPPLLKQWIDMVLEFGWAYGPGGIHLKDKVIFNCITTGGAREAYGREGHNYFTIRELLAPFEQTARLCKMIYLPPFAVQGTHRLTDEQLDNYEKQYSILLNKLSEENFDTHKISGILFLNDICVINA
ncbi:MAG: NAD(P)H-dependent oxidoreductase [Cytophagaceae bacterium]|nr:NAD(P)H-dependent oxidoreductase [Cytophagaceae bacterium]